MSEDYNPFPPNDTWLKDYKRNFLIVPILCMLAMCVVTLQYVFAGNCFDTTYWWVLCGIIALNLFILWYCRYRYKKDGGNV